MIRFSAALVVIALGILAAGVATSKLMLVYVAIGVSALSLVCFVIGVILKRGELFGAPARLAPSSGFVATGERFAPADEYVGADRFAGHEAQRPPARQQAARPAATASRGAHSAPRRQSRPEADSPAFGVPLAYSGQGRDSGREQPRGPRHQADSGRPPRSSGPLGAQGAPGSPGDRQAPPRRQETGPQERPPMEWPPPERSPQERPPQEWSQPGGVQHGTAAADGSARPGSYGAGSPPAAQVPPAYKEPSLVRPWVDQPSARPPRPAPGQRPEWSERLDRSDRPGARPEPPRPEPAYTEPPRPEPAYIDPFPPEPAYTEPPRPQPFRPEPSRPEPPRFEPPRPEPAYTDPFSPEPPRPEPAYSEPAYSEPPRPEDSRSEAAPPEEPAAFWGGSTASSRSGAADIPPPVAPIYPDRDKPRESDASAEEPTPALLEPADDPVWFTDTQASADEEETPAAPADEPEPAGDDEPATDTEAVTGAEEPAATESATGTETVADSSETDAESPADDEPAAAEDSSSSHDEELAGEDAAASAAPPDREVTVVPGVPRYHRNDCILIRFMGEEDLETKTIQSAEETGCTPCRACQPDQAAEDTPTE